MSTQNFCMEGTTSHNNMDTKEENSIPLDLALRQKLTLIRILKSKHHREFLKKRLKVGRIPTGLKI